MAGLWFAINGAMAYVVYSDCLNRTKSSAQAMLWALLVYILGVATFVLGLLVLAVYFLFAGFTPKSKVCSTCFSDVPPGEDACPACGEVFASARAKEVLCKNCRGVCHDGNRFCPTCGAMLVDLLGEGFVLKGNQPLD